MLLKLKMQNVALQVLKRPTFKKSYGETKTHKNQKRRKIRTLKRKKRIKEEEEKE